MGIQTIKDMLAFNQQTAFHDEVADRKRLISKSIYLGIPALDHAFKSLLPNDFCIIAAKTGSGKTELITQIALNIAGQKKRCDLFALEASKFEIHRRLKYKVLTGLYRADGGEQHLSYSGWIRFAYDQLLEKYALAAEEQLAEISKYLYVHYRTSSFDIKDFIKMYNAVAGKSSCVLADHAHFFTKDEKTTDSEHMRSLALQMFDMANKFEVPIVMASHLRKVDSDKQYPDENDIYGASELSKAATRIMIICRGDYRADKGGYETVFRVPKNREESPTALRVLFSMEQKKYSDAFQEGQIVRDEFVEKEQLQKEQAKHAKANR